MFFSFVIALGTAATIPRAKVKSLTANKGFN